MRSRSSRGGHTSATGAVKAAGVGTATCTVTLDRAPAEDVTVNWAVTGSRPLLASDFLDAEGNVATALPSGSATIASGETTGTIAVRVRDDDAFEPDTETFTVTLVEDGTPDVLVAAPASVETMIADDDPMLVPTGIVVAVFPVDVSETVIGEHDAIDLPIDLPPVAPVVERHRRLQCVCSGCGATTKVPFPVVFNSCCSDS